MLQGEHFAILSTFIKLPLSINTLILSIFKWPLKTGFTVYLNTYCTCKLLSFYVQVLPIIESSYEILVLTAYESSEGPDKSLLLT